MFLPKEIHNGGNYIISLSELCGWMGEKAEAAGVDVLAGITGNSLLKNPDGSIGGVITGDMGLNKDGTQSDSFEPGIKIKAR